MTTVMTHETSTDEPVRPGIAARLLVPGFWGAVRIVAMWLAVLFDGIFGGNMVCANAGVVRRSSRPRCSWGCSPSSARRPSPSASSAAGMPAEQSGTAARSGR
jgi:hypothetical protein